MRKHWEPLHHRRKNESNKGKPCSIYGCPANARSKGLCMNHCMQKRYHEQHPKTS